MTNNICGNSASPLRGGGRLFAHVPTLRIGLISLVPPAQSVFSLGRCVVLVIFLIATVGCTSRVEYVPTNGSAASANALNINTASADELERLPHIGRKTAEAIVEFRTANGAFRRVENLMQIRGVSEERFAELRSHIRIE